MKNVKKTYANVAKIEEKACTISKCMYVCICTLHCACAAVIKNCHFAQYSKKKFSMLPS